MSPHERQVWRLALLVPLPGVALAVWLLWDVPMESGMRWTIASGLVLVTLLLVGALQQRVTRPLRVLANMLAAVRERDFSMRAQRPDPSDALGLAMVELNALMDELRSRRLGSLEATSLLRQVMHEIDVAIIAFDDARNLRDVNAAGETLLGAPAARLMGRSAEALGLAPLLDGEVPRTVRATIGGRDARWEVRRGAFRQDGRPHQFVMLSDVSRALRAEEQQAWERLVRVLGHEIRNSLTPIASLSDRLGELVQRVPAERALPEELRTDMVEGLRLISTRSGGLTRFMASYTQMLRVPPPRPAPVRIDALVARVAQLETRCPVHVADTGAVIADVDVDQVEQLLINLVRNAAEASAETGGAVEVRVETATRAVTIVIDDEGPGVPETANLFVPFFTTKPGGT
ncbi:MAG: ATP-binding protein, partial [Gemmatimonadaceae bacterium]|nr:ATP-binding protein [Gemmatimonadaceae bacterium]